MLNDDVFQLDTSLKTESRFAGMMHGLAGPLQASRINKAQARAAGIMMVVLHPISWWACTQYQPQPYENLWIRGALLALGVPVFFADSLQKRFKWDLYPWVRVAIFMNLCVFIPWMYLHNPTGLWMGSMVAAVLIYFSISDWRLGIIGTIGGGVIASLAFRGVASHWDWRPIYSEEFLLAMSLAICIGLAQSAFEVAGRRARLRAVSSLVGIMAHELRTPLAAISLSTQVLHDAVEDMDEAERLRIASVLGNIDLSLRRMNAIIDMQIANAKFGNITVKQVPVNLTDVIKDLVQTYPFKSKAEAESLVTTLHSDATVMGSKLLMNQVLSNLLKNALTAVAKTGRSPAPGDVTLEVTRIGREAVMVLRDKGCGMSDEGLRRVFEPFYSTSPGASHGLGMPFARQVLHYFHANIDVSSVEGQGTVITVAFPLAKRAAAADAVETGIDSAWS